MRRSQRNRIERTLRSRVQSVEPLEGGTIGSVEKVDLSDGRTIVAKTSDTPLTVEAQMLEFLAERGVRVPAVLDATDDLLLLEYVSGTSTITESVDRDAASKVATLHEKSAQSFGFPFDTLIGSIEQPNPWTDSWIAFYRDQRLRPVLELTRRSGSISEALRTRYDAVLADLPSILTEPAEPALIHGDLWTNNVLADGERIVAFLDPACYYAHPEIELAYVDWIGTFGPAFFERYDRLYGIEDGFFSDRRFVYRLYPLLFHVELVGPTYLEELESTLSRLGY